MCDSPVRLFVRGSVLFKPLIDQVNKTIAQSKHDTSVHYLNKKLGRILWVSFLSFVIDICNAETRRTTIGPFEIIQKS